MGVPYVGVNRSVCNDTDNFSCVLFIIDIPHPCVGVIAAFILQQTSVSVSASPSVSVLASVLVSAAA